MLLACALEAGDKLTIAETPLDIHLKIHLTKQTTASVLQFIVQIRNEKLPLQLSAHIDPSEETTREALLGLANNREYFLGLASKSDLANAEVARIQIQTEGFTQKILDQLSEADKHNRTIPKTKRDFASAKRDTIGN